MPRRGNDVVVICWRDIPAQVNGQAGRDRHQVAAVGQVPAGHRPGQAQGQDPHRPRGRRPVATGQPAVRRRRGRGGAAEAERLEAAYSPERLGELAFAGGWESDLQSKEAMTRTVTASPATRPCEPLAARCERRTMTQTVVSSATKEVVIGFDRPFVMIGERINPTGRKLLAEEMKAGDFSRVEADAVAQVAAGAHMLDVNAGIPLADEPALLARRHPARAVGHRRAAVHRLVDRRGARGRAGRVPGQAAGQLGDRRGRGDGARAAARRPLRRRRRRHLQRRDRHQRGPGRPLLDRQAHRRTGRRPRDPRPRRGRRPAGHADRRAWAPPASRPSR